MEPEFTTNLGLIILFPVLGMLINGFWGRKLSPRLIAFVGCAASGAAFVVAVLAVRELLARQPEHRFVTQIIYDWLNFLGEKSSSFNFGASLSFALDPLGATMLMVVTGVGFVIHLYSINYMAGDEGYARFFSYMNLFLSAMLILILADNLVLMFVGWEGVGLASYLLIGFWFKDLANATAGKKAFIVNRIGDFGFLIGIFLVVMTFDTVNFSAINERLQGLETGGQIDFDTAFATAIGIFLFIGACGKSAQIPLHVWLPDAMAGPTPVSALIHAATMVTAGVYMVGRMGAVYSCSETALLVIALVGGVTALFAATIGLAQNDIKKVLAYSTVSQLGYMFVGMSLGAAGYAYGIFHLTTHAFFKAILFLGAGSVIMGMHHEQDMRKMGGLWRRMPFTFACMVAGALALAGVPPFSGFWSKDAILHHAAEAALHAHSTWGAVIYSVAFTCGLVGAVITAFYITRLVAMTFFGKPRTEAAEHAQENKAWVMFALAILLILTIFGGVVLEYAPHGGWHGWLEPSFEPAAAAEEAILTHGLVPADADGHMEVGDAAEHGEAHGGATIKYVVMGLSIAAALLGIVAAGLFYMRRPGAAAAWVAARPGRQKIHRTLENKYYVDEFYERNVVAGLDQGSSFLFRRVDVGLIDGLFNGLARFAREFGWTWASLQNGQLGRYAGLFALGGVVVMIVALFGVRG